MIVVSKSFGFALCFEDGEDLATVINHLQGMAQAASKGQLQAPYIYGVYDESVEEERATDELKKIKAGVNTMRGPQLVKVDGEEPEDEEAAEESEAAGTETQKIEPVESDEPAEEEGEDRGEE